MYLSSGTRRLFRFLAVILGTILGSCLFIDALDRPRYEGDIKGISMRLDAAHSASQRLFDFRGIEGENATLEACFDGAFDKACYENRVLFAFWIPKTAELIAKLPLDARSLATARVRDNAFCVDLGEGVLPSAGTYAVDATWEGVDAKLVPTSPVYIHALLAKPIKAYEAWAIAIFCLICALFPLLYAPRNESEGRHDEAFYPLPAWARVTIACGAFTATLVLSSFLPGGTIGILARGFLIIAVQGFFVGRFASSDELGVSTVLPKLLPSIVGAVALALCAWKLGDVWSHAFAPKLGTRVEAPIELWLNWPSDRIAIALVSTLAPIAEEYFFRGFLFGAIASKTGKIVSVIVTTLLFTAAHVPQVWGAWNSLVPIFALGLGLGMMRAVTRSVRVSTFAHASYNALNILRSFRSLL